MCIWNKILLGLIFVVSIVFFILGARALKTHQYWRDIARKHERLVEEEKDRRDKLLNGADQEGEEPVMGLRKATLELHKLTVDRGRVWYGCRPQKVDVQKDPNTGQEKVTVVLATDQPDPHGISVQSVHFLFEELPEESPANQNLSYLGEFAVTNVAQKQLALQPSRRLSPREFQTLQKSQQAKALWTLYEVMPVDDHAIFARMSDEEKKAILPADTLAEYFIDGQVITKGEMAKRGLKGKVLAVDENGEVITDEQGIETEIEEEEAKGKYVRQLRDYEVLLAEFHRLRSKGLDMLEATARDKKYMEAAVADARQQEQFRLTEIDQLKAKSAKVAAERQMVDTHRTVLEATIAAMQAAIANLIETNRAAVGEIARIQLEASRLIDERTRKMTRVASGK